MATYTRPNQNSLTSEKIILVTGATGKQGGAAVRHLLGRGFKVRAITRDPEKPASQSLKAIGVQVVKGDMEDLSSLQPAMQGVYGVFSLQNYWEKGVGYNGEIRQARHLAQAAKDEGVNQLVQSSIAGCDDAHGVEHFESKWEIEKMLAALDLPHTNIRTVFFMENFLDTSRPSMPGLAGALRPDTRFHLISVEDIGWFVTEAFANPSVYLGKTIDIAGDCLSVEEMKRIYKTVTGRNPSRLVLPFWMIKLLSAEIARQFDWNNNVGWHFNIQPLRELHPGMVSFENFLKAHPTVKL